MYRTLLFSFTLASLLSEAVSDAQDFSGEWELRTGASQQETSWTWQQSSGFVTGTMTAPMSPAWFFGRPNGTQLNGLLTYPAGFPFPTPGVLISTGNDQSLSGTWYEWLVIPRSCTAQRATMPPTRIISDGFETGLPSDQWDELNFIAGPSGQTPSTIGRVEEGVSHSGRYALRVRYTKDEDSAKLVKMHPIGDEGQLYVRFWQMFPQGFNQRNLKQTRIFYSPGADCETTDGSPITYEGISELLFWGNIPGQQMVAAAYHCPLDEPAAIGEYFPYTFAPNEWVKVAMYVKYNHPAGTRNGIFRVWRNDQLMLDRTDVMFLKDQVKSVVDGVWVGGNYSGAGVAPAPFDRYLDDILIADTPDGDIPLPSLAPTILMPTRSPSAD